MTTASSRFNIVCIQTILKSEYKWINGAAKECEILELRILEDMLKKEDLQNKKIFVDTNISIETLRKIAKHDHVLIMLSDPDISVRRFFERPDKEKQFLYQLIMEEPDPEAALQVSAGYHWSGTAGLQHSPPSGKTDSTAIRRRNG